MPSISAPASHRPLRERAIVSAAPIYGSVQHLFGSASIVSRQALSVSGTSTTATGFPGPAIVWSWTIESYCSHISCLLLPLGQPIIERRSFSGSVHISFELLTDDLSFMFEGSAEGQYISGASPRIDVGRSAASSPLS